MAIAQPEKRGIIYIRYTVDMICCVLEVHFLFIGDFNHIIFVFRDGERATVSGVRVQVSV